MSQYVLNCYDLNLNRTVAELLNLLFIKCINNFGVQKGLEGLEGFKKGYGGVTGVKNSLF